MSSSSDKHLWLPNPAGETYKYFVAAVSNIRWPLASVLPQVAVCGFFPTFESAQAYQTEVQRYKDEARSIPDGSIFMVLETARLFPLATSPRRLLGDQSVHVAKKRDAVLRNYYRKRQLDKQDVAARKGKEDAVAPKPLSGSELEKDKRLKRTVERRARRQAWDLLQRLHSQKARVDRAREAVTTERLEDLEDAEMKDFLASLTESERAAFAHRGAASGEATGGGAGGGAGAGAGAGGGGVTMPEMELREAEVQMERKTEVAKNTRLGSIDEYIAWAIAHFKSINVSPANDDTMDAEEKEREALELARLHGKSGEGVAPAAHKLPPPPANQNFCVGSIFYDTSGEALNADCPEATGKEHIVTFFEPFATSDAARSALEATYKGMFSEEKLFFVRMGQWCCFDHVTDDDGQQMYREEMIGEIFKSHAENSMLKFVEESFKHRPDVLPIPTTK
jgi:hypothetical protein